MWGGGWGGVCCDARTRNPSWCDKGSPGRVHLSSSYLITVDNGRPERRRRPAVFTMMYGALRTRLLIRPPPVYAAPLSACPVSRETGDTIEKVHRSTCSLNDMCVCVCVCVCMWKANLSDIICGLLWMLQIDTDESQVWVFWARNVIQTYIWDTLYSTELCRSKQ